MSGLEGHDPPQVPHCKQVIRISPPGVFFITSLLNSPEYPSMGVNDMPTPLDSGLERPTVRDGEPKSAP